MRREQQAFDARIHAAANQWLDRASSLAGPRSATKTNRHCSAIAWLMDLEFQLQGAFPVLQRSIQAARPRNICSHPARLLPLRWERVWWPRPAWENPSTTPQAWLGAQRWAMAFLSTRCRKGDVARGTLRQAPTC